MQPELKDLMEELQIAFNESVCESDRIAAVLAEIKSVGYDVLLALDVTIGVSAAKKDAVESAAPAPLAQPAEFTPAGEFRLTLEDEQFLQALRIGIH